MATESEAKEPEYGAGLVCTSEDLERGVLDLLAEPSDREAARLRAEMILERSLNYRQWVRLLHETLDVPDEVLARVAKVVPGSVRRWRSSDSEVGEPRLAQAQAIERLRSIALVLVQSGTFYDLRGVGVWLQTGRKELAWRAPYEILADDPQGFAKVLEQAEMFVGPGAGSVSQPATHQHSSVGSRDDHVRTRRVLPAGFGPPRAELSCTQVAASSTTAPTRRRG